MSEATSWRLYESRDASPHVVYADTQYGPWRVCAFAHHGYDTKKYPQAAAMQLEFARRFVAAMNSPSPPGPL